MTFKSKKDIEREMVELRVVVRESLDSLSKVIEDKKSDIDKGFVIRGKPLLYDIGGLIDNAIAQLKIMQTIHRNLKE